MAKSTKKTNAEHPLPPTKGYVQLHQEDSSNLMFQASEYCNIWLEEAVALLPEEVLDKYKHRLLIICNDERHACRIPPSVAQNRDIIFLAERIAPPHGSDIGQGCARYFIFVVLHEIAHAVLNHKSPTLSKLTPEEDRQQEADADKSRVFCFDFIKHCE